MAKPCSHFFMKNIIKVKSKMVVSKNRARGMRFAQTKRQKDLKSEKVWDAIRLILNLVIRFEYVHYVQNRVKLVPAKGDSIVDAEIRAMEKFLSEISKLAESYKIDLNNRESKRRLISTMFETMNNFRAIAVQEKKKGRIEIVDHLAKSLTEILKISVASEQVKEWFNAPLISAKEQLGRWAGITSRSQIHAVKKRNERTNKKGGALFLGLLDRSRSARIQYDLGRGSIQMILKRVFYFDHKTVDGMMQALDNVQLKGIGKFK